MFKLLVLVCAVAAAAASPGIIGTPLVHTYAAAPVLATSHYATPIAYANPLAYSAAYVKPYAAIATPYAYGLKSPAIYSTGLRYY